MFERALARTEDRHPALGSICRIDARGIYLDGVSATVVTHGLAAVNDAIEAFLAALLEILGRLIGEDMALRLLYLDTPRTDMHKDTS